MAGAILALRIINTLVGVLGVLGNTTVLAVIYNVKFMHTFADGFIFNQAAVDFFGSLFLILSTNLLPPDPLPDTAWYRFVCYIWSSKLFHWSFFTSSTMNLLSLMSERYIAITFPLWHSRLYTKRSMAFIVSAVWLYGLAITGLFVAVTRTYEAGRCYKRAFVGSHVLSICLLIVKFFLPAVIMGVFFSHMTVHLKRRSTRPSTDSQPTVSETHQARPPLHRARLNMLKTIFIVFIAFLICWTPNQVVFVMSNLGWPLDDSGPFYIVTVSLVAINSCINPLIYTLKYKRFRRALRTFCHNSTSQENQEINPAANTTILLTVTANSLPDNN